MLNGFMDEKVQLNRNNNNIFSLHAILYQIIYILMQNSVNFSSIKP